MDLQNSRSNVNALEPTVDVLNLIRACVRRVCSHAELRPVGDAASVYECTNCGQHVGVLHLLAGATR